MRILVPIEDLEPVPTKTWPGPDAQPTPPTRPSPPAQPKKPQPPHQRPAPPRSAPRRQPVPAHPTAAIATTTIDKRARLTDVSSGTGYDIATGERREAAKVAATAPAGFKSAASAPLPFNVNVANAPLVRGHRHLDLPSLDTISDLLTGVTIGGEVVAVAFPPAAEFALPVAEGAQALNAAIEVHQVVQHPTAEGGALLLTDVVLVGAGRAASRVPALSTPRGQQAARVVVLTSDLALLTGTTVEKTQPRQPRPSQPTLRPGR